MMGVGPATWKKNRIEEEVERETAVRFRTLVVRNSILVLARPPAFVSGKYTVNEHWVRRSASP